jgi:hypothetical protein
VYNSDNKQEQTTGATAKRASIINTRLYNLKKEKGVERDGSR